MKTDSAPAAPHKTTYLKDYEPYPYAVEKVELTVKIFDGHTRVVSHVTYGLKAGPIAEPDLMLHGHGQKVHGILLNGAPLPPDRYRLSREGFVMPCPGGRSFTLTFDTEIEPEANTTLEGFYKSGDIYCTQCESEGFRRITFYPDRPDVMSVFTVRIEADKTTLPVLLANGNLIEQGDLADGRHYSTWHDPFKKPAYLYAMVAGNLAYIEDRYKTMLQRDVTLRIYTRPADIDQAGFGMEALKQSMHWDEMAYGREYDLDIFNIVAVSDFNFGAMENKSLNIFNTSRILTRPDLTTDKEFLDIRRIVGHEYFHNWSGNRVTCRDWFQLSLKEGFTVFRENQFGQATFDPEVERIDEVNLVRTMQFTEDSGPMAHPVRPDNYIEISNFYTMTVYEKGGEVIRMLHTLLGPAKFREASDLYFNRHDGDAATCENFVKCMEDASGRNFTQFMRWYHQAGTPRVKASGAYDAGTKTYTLTLEQTLPDTPGQPAAAKKVQHIPVAVGLIGPNGEDMGETRVLELTEGRQTFTFENIGSRPVPSVLRGFSAPVILEMDESEADLAFRMVHDSDGVNRWDAGQKLMMQALSMKLAGTAGADTFIDRLIAALANMIDLMRDKKRALLARMLTLPEDSIIAAAHQPVDPAAIHAARRVIEGRMANALKDRLLSLYNDNATQGAFSLDPEPVARRALRNVALALLTSADDAAEGVRLASAQFQSGTTMTEKLGALKAVADFTGPDRDRMIQNFYDQFRQYELVVDKWFSLQAGAARKSIVADVTALLAHPDFNWKTPNRVRSVLGAFAMRNMAGFHDPSGAGYTLLTDAVIRLNGSNPAMAARLLTPMRDWKTFRPELAQKMKAELERILHSGDLSPDVFEVVSKTLNG